MVLFHGGSWLDEEDLSILRPVADDLERRGWAVWNVEYRRLGEDGAGWPGTFADVGAAVDHLTVLAEDRPLDLDRVAVLGHSAGGTLALYAAGRPGLAQGDPGAGPAVTVTGAASLAGVTDLIRCSASGLLGPACPLLVGGEPGDVPDRYAVASPQERLPLGVRQLIAHGRQDAVVPFSYSQAYVQSARSRGDEVTFLELDQADHFSLVDVGSQAWKRVAGALGNWR